MDNNILHKINKDIEEIDRLEKNKKDNNTYITESDTSENTDKLGDDAKQLLKNLDEMIDNETNNKSKTIQKQIKINKPNKKRPIINIYKFNSNNCSSWRGIILIFIIVVLIFFLCYYFYNKFATQK
jgi:hypothetical protein